MRIIHHHFLVLGCIGAGLSVALGAFAAHALKDSLSEKMLSVFQTGVEYQAYHSLAMLVLVLLASLARTEKARRYLSVSMSLMLFGVVLFSGSLYALALTGLASLGMITPVGGVLFLLAWFFAARGAWSMGKPELLEES
ncbi:hypothetical protein A3742_07040 [Oleiphilus sp. HI0071]|nr:MULTISPECIES: DUF423 domain-containing protein [unclassified Oleiphilus]KZY61204.1 hypothetical protein A3737_22340 [Oleiphilus sp. HI0065]KZY83469.1 hypothetical protein A3742_07040 [Oleiphilus sp. HI0071]KZY99530.1 hypothetical protein A3744_30355 [Oleiphilus sp. HI0073]KZZ39955.1 hypothetical protein A3758_24925 [Oleiphilus sp. HI0118]KZZ52180.1 hypothetical protein A3760_18220 [Oleiphilus sp. HI0122]KZZ63703.1 hypothetical protein A3765_22020 [Oleiphilus sp. HI0130]KZZ77234.1 hypothet